MKEEGKYIAYLTSLEGSGLAWSDDLQELKDIWSFGTAIFESNGFTSPQRRAMGIDCSLTGSGPGGFLRHVHP